MQRRGLDARVFAAGFHLDSVLRVALKVAPAYTARTIVRRPSKRRCGSRRTQPGACATPFDEVVIIRWASAGSAAAAAREGRVRAAARAGAAHAECVKPRTPSSSYREGTEAVSVCVEGWGWGGDAAVHVVVSPARPSGAALRRAPQDRAGSAVGLRHPWAKGPWAPAALPGRRRRAARWP